MHHTRTFLVSLIFPALLACSQDSPEPATTDLHTLSGPDLRRIQLELSGETKLERVREIYTLPDAQWQSHASVPSFPIGTGEVWIRRTIRLGESPLLLRSRSPWHDHEYFFALDAAGTIVHQFEGGDREPLSSDAQWIVHPTYRLDASPGESLTLIGVIKSTGTISPEMDILPPDTLYARARTEYIGNTILITIIFLLGVYGTGMYLLAGIPAMSRFAIAQFANTFVFLIASDLARELVFQNGGYPVNELAYSVACVMIAALIGFARTFLRTKAHLPILDAVLKVTEGLFWLFAVLALFPQATGLSLLIVNYLAPVCMVLLLLAGALSLYRRINGALIYTASTLWFFLGLLLAELAHAGLLSSAYFKDHGITMGQVAAALGYAAALALRLRKIEIDGFAARSRLAMLDQEFTRARQIHSQLLPRRLPEISGVELQVHYDPVATVGGNFYAFHQADENDLTILIADAAGHGLAAALDAAMVNVAFQSSVRHSSSPAEIIESMNRFLSYNADKRFVNAAIVRVMPLEARFTAACAGKPTPIYANSNEAAHLQSDGPVLAYDPRAIYSDVHGTWNKDSRLLLYTPGLTRGQGGVDQDRLLSMMGEQQDRREPLDEFANRLLGIRDGVRDTPDDTTIILVGGA